MVNVFSRRWRLFALWYGEAALAVSAWWALSHGRDWHAVPEALFYLLVCGAAISLPGPALRALLTALKAGPRVRRSVLQMSFALSAAATAAALSVADLRLAAVCGLLLGSVLWALELESREQHRGRGRPPTPDAADGAAERRQAGKQAG